MLQNQLSNSLIVSYNNSKKNRLNSWRLTKNQNLRYKKQKSNSIKLRKTTKCSLMNSKKRSSDAFKLIYLKNSFVFRRIRKLKNLLMKERIMRMSLILFKKSTVKKYRISLCFNRLFISLNLKMLQLKSSSKMERQFIFISCQNYSDCCNNIC